MLLSGTKVLRSTRQTSQPSSLPPNPCTAFAQSKAASARLVSRSNFGPSQMRGILHLAARSRATSVHSVLHASCIVRTSRAPHATCHTMPITIQRVQRQSFGAICSGMAQNDIDKACRSHFLMPRAISAPRTRGASCSVSTSAPRSAAADEQPRRAVGAPAASASALASPKALALHAAKTPSRTSSRMSAAAPAAKPAAWNSGVEFFSAKVLSRDLACPQGGLHTVQIEVPAPVAEGYSVPGQYVQLKVGDSDVVGYFALAAPPAFRGGKEPTSAVVELLVKETASPNTAAALLARTTAAAPVLVSKPCGRGFPLVPRVAGQGSAPPRSFNTLLMFATGSGVSPFRALLNAGLAGASAGAATNTLPQQIVQDVLRKAGQPAPARTPGDGAFQLMLWWGTRDDDHTPYLEEAKLWQAAGVDVVVVHSQPPKPATAAAAKGRAGKGRYVQEAFAAEGVTLLTARQGAAWTRGTIALLCGHKNMCKSLTDVLTRHGVAKEDILLNF